MNKRIRTWTPLLIALIAGSFLIPQFAHAQTTVYFSMVSKIMLGISDAINSISGIAVAIASWAVGIILELNARTLESGLVSFGFPVVLSIANLGFVAGIIVIGISTILREEGYGIKKILGKLIVMAVVVNFSLILAGGILTFADSLTKYFLDSINPATQGISGYTSFSNALTGAFNPQKALAPPVDTNDSKASLFGSFVRGAILPTQEDFGGMVSLTAGILFSNASLVIMVITLVTFILMLLVRYVYVSVLLVIMPLAWLAWVFPSLSKHFKTWWDKFIQQVFFAPIVVFFLWAAIKTAYLINDNHTLQSFQTQGSAGEIFKTFAGGLFQGIIGNLLQSSVVVGLMMGGLFAANKMGIMFADTATKTVTGVKDWAIGKATSAGKAARRGTQRAATGGLRSKEARDETARLQKSAKIFDRIRGNIRQRLASTGGESQVKEVAGGMKDYNDDRLAGELKSSSAARRVAAAQMLKDKKRFDLLQEKADVLQEMQKRGDFVAMGQVKLSGEIDKAVGSNSEMRDAVRALEEAEKAGKDLSLERMTVEEKDGEGKKTGNEVEVNTQEYLQKETDGFVKKMTKEEAGRLPMAKIFKNPVLAEALMTSIANNAAQLMPSIIAKNNSETNDKIQKTYLDTIDKMLAAITTPVKAQMDELKDLTQKSTKSEAALKLIDKDIASAKNALASAVLPEVKKEFQDKIDGYETNKKTIQAGLDIYVKRKQEIEEDTTFKTILEKTKGLEKKRDLFKKQIEQNNMSTAAPEAEPGKAPEAGKPPEPPKTP